VRILDVGRGDVQRAKARGEKNPVRLVEGGDKNWEKESAGAA